MPERGHSLSDRERDAALLHLRSLVANGSLSLDRFSDLTDTVLRAESYDDLDQLLRTVPSVVAFTPADRRMTEPLRFSVNTGTVKMTGRWQVAERTVARVNTGTILLDVTAAEFDARVVDFDLDVNTGGITLVVPAGVTVQVVEAGNLRNDLVDDLPLPGAPLIRLRARVGTGTVRLRRPAPEKRRRLRRWLRRRRRTACSD